MFLTVVHVLDSHGEPAKNAVSWALLQLSLITVSGEGPREIAFPVGSLVTVTCPNI